MLELNFLLLVVFAAFGCQLDGLVGLGGGLSGVNDDFVIFLLDY